MIIANKARKIDSYQFNFYGFSAARDALSAIIANEKNYCHKILIPAYIGFSVREGSGIFDPIKKSSIQYEFYAMTEMLHIDYQMLKEQIENNPNSLVLIVHYWGFIDPNYEKIKGLARLHDCKIVEDFAHALFTYFVSPVIDFDYAFFSLHKMLPYESGGLLISKLGIDGLHKEIPAIFEYNFSLITQARLKNYYSLLAEFDRVESEDFLVLRKELDRSIPQTFPILMRSNALRDFLYFKMNELGFGVVSLYHQLIDEVENQFPQNKKFANEKNISSRILNLPIHQDASVEAIKKMALCLFHLCKEYERNVENH